MGNSSPRDLTRWNRAGLARFRYIDGNAATYLEQLRLGLLEAFAKRDGTNYQGSGDSRTESDADRLSRLQDQYEASTDDVLWSMSRTFARSCHVLTEYINAYANESYLATATQWDSVRHLVQMLDCYPRPPASASVWLALKAKTAGQLAPGLQVKYTPTDGSAPIVFETLSEIDVDDALNELRPVGWNCNPDGLGGRRLILETSVKGLKIGQPVVLENQADGRLQAFLIEGAAEKDGHIVLTVAPPLPTDFAVGGTIVHAVPEDVLAPLGPAATGARVGHTLQLSGPAGDLQAGEVVIVSVPGKKPRFRSIEHVEATRVTFDMDAGDFDLANTRLSRPAVLAVSQHGKRKTASGDVLDIVYAAGDWTRLAGQWLAHQRYIARQRYLPVYEVMHAKYVPVGNVDPKTVQPDDKPGFTALTLRWNKAEDDVDLDKPDLSLNHPQTLLIPPVAPGAWQADLFLQRSAGGHLPAVLATRRPKKTGPGDLAVVVRGRQVAWARLQSVEPDLDQDRASLCAAQSWQDRGGGPFYLSDTRVYSHFKSTVRLAGWTANNTPISGRSIPLDAVPSSLTPGRVLLVRTGAAALKTKAAEVTTSATGAKAASAKAKAAKLRATSAAPQLILRDDLPADATYGNLVILANAVDAGHGETRPERVLGSGAAATSSQSFLLQVKDISFVPDDTQPNGVRADIVVKIGVEIWIQVGNLKDSGPADAHYTARITEDHFLEIAFGDGANGRRLPTGEGNLRVTFRQGAGARGNLPPGSLIQLVKPHRLIGAVEQPLLASGGADLEDVEGMRTTVPAQALPLERAVSLQDFAHIASRHSTVAQAQAFSLRTGYGQKEQIELVIVPAGDATLTDDLKATLTSFVMASAPPGLAMTVSLYQEVIVSFAVAAWVKTDSFDADEVSANVRQALVEAFGFGKRSLGQPLYISELYQIVEGTEGVEDSDCEITIVEAPSDPAKVLDDRGAIRVVRPTARACVHLDSIHPDVTVTVEKYSP